MQTVQLSKADSCVLAQVFDPESSPGKVEVIVDPRLPADRCIQDSALLSQLKNRERDAISHIERCEKTGGDAQSKDAAFQAALNILDRIISEHPEYASARNNRAQLRRWRFGDRHMLCQPQRTSEESRQTAAGNIIQDLKKSIALASPSRPQDAVSPSQGRLLAQAYTQLGAVYYAAFKDLDEEPTMDVFGTDEASKSTGNKQRFEEEASRMFYLGGLYGNEVAKALAVHTNPHAKLCGSIVKEAMKKELAGIQA